MMKKKVSDREKRFLFGLVFASITSEVICSTDHGIRATAIIPGEVDTPILEGRPAPPDADARATMMQPEDVASMVVAALELPRTASLAEIEMRPMLKSY